MVPLLRGLLAETGLQMAFDDFVIERNLVSCLQTNEVNTEDSGRERTQSFSDRERGETGGEEKKKSSVSGVSALRFLKNSCHPALPPHHSHNNHITMQNSSSGLLCLLKAESVREKMRGQMEVKLIYFCNYFNFFWKLNW